MPGVTRVREPRSPKPVRVVGDRMDKTSVVAVGRLARHRLYKRVIRLTTKFKAHDELNEAKVGDLVRIEESRPLSATKRWRLAEILSRAGEAQASSPQLEEEEDTTEAIHRSAHPGRVRLPAAELDEPVAPAARADEPVAEAEAPAADEEPEPAPAE